MEQYALTFNRDREEAVKDTKQSKPAGSTEEEGAPHTGNDNREHIRGEEEKEMAGEKVVGKREEEP